VDPAPTAAGSAVASSGRMKPDAATAAAADLAAEGKSTVDDDDWLAVAATGERRSDASPSSPASKSPVRPKAAGRSASGGAWLAAATGKLGLAQPLENGDRNGAVSGKRKLPAHTEGQKPKKPGGWMLTAAISPGYLGAASSGEAADFGDEARVARGVDIETQTDDNLGQQATVPENAKLPPWAKPWSPPPPKGGVEPGPNTSTEIAAASEATRNPDPSPGDGIGWIKGASVDSSGSKPQGELD